MEKTVSVTQTSNLFPGICKSNVSYKERLENGGEISQGDLCDWIWRGNVIPVRDERELQLEEWMLKNRCQLPCG